MFAATLLNGNTAMRANEFVGVAPGNPWDGGNPGRMAAVLKPGDFIWFDTSPAAGDIDGDGDVDSGDVSLFVDVLLGIPPPPAYALRAALDGDGEADGNDLGVFIEIVRGDG